LLIFPYVLGLPLDSFLLPIRLELIKPLYPYAISPGPELLVLPLKNVEGVAILAPRTSDALE
jgi:hypothetical protein